MYLYVFDKDINLEGKVGDYSSFIRRRRYSKCGEFELHCKLDMHNLNLLKKGNIIWGKGDIEAGYIQYKHLKEDKTGKEILVVKGKFMTGYLNRRINWEQITYNGAVNELIEEIINKNAIDPVNPDRAIPKLIFDESNIFTEEISYQNGYGNVLGILEGLSETEELGFKTRFDYKGKQLIFETYKGLDRTSGQNINPRAIFSKEFENILEQEYVDSDIDYKNTALILGEGEGTERERISIEGGQGLDRYEMYVDARDLQSTKTVNEVQVDIPIEEYREILRNRGLSKLDEHKRIETFDSKINLRSNLEYKKDFDLGDMVTCVSKKWGITVDTRITEVEEIYEESGLEINIIFGNNIPTLIDKIKAVM